MTLLLGSDGMEADPTCLGSGTSFLPLRPTGVVHAVTPDQRVALCGHRPAIVWAGLAWETAELSRPCPACALLVARGTAPAAESGVPARAAASR